MDGGDLQVNNPDQQPQVGLLDNSATPVIPRTDKALKRWDLILPTIGVLILMGVFLGGWKVWADYHKRQVIKTEPSQSINLAAISQATSSFKVTDSDRVLINGQLTANQGLVLTPSPALASPTIGSIYIDQTSHQIRYYNGQTYVTLASQSDLQALQASIPTTTATNTVINQVGVSSLQGQTGPITLLGGSGLVISNSGKQITLALPQNLATTAGPTFASMILNGSLSLGSTGSGQLTINANGRSYILPTTGPVSQTICTTGITCVAGGGQAVDLAPGSAQSNNSPTDSSIFLKNTGGADLLQLQDATSDVFTVAQSGATSIKNTLTVTAGGANITGGLTAAGAVTFSGLNSIGVVQTNGSGVLSTSNLNLGTGPITGTLGVANGGTGATSFTANGILYGNGAGVIQVTAAGLNNQCLIGNTGSAPTWGSCPGAGGAPSSSAFLTVGNDASLSSERAITTGTNLTFSDGGANSTYTLSVVNNPTFSGLITANAGLTVPIGQTFTFDGDAFTDLTGTGLQISGGALQTTLGTDINLASAEVTGILGYANGGTNANSAQNAINNLSGLTTKGDLLYQDGTNSTRLARGVNGDCLISNGTTILWSSCSGAAGGANTALSNLVSTQINQDLLPDATANNRNLGSASNVWQTAYLSTAVLQGSNSITLGKAGPAGNDGTIVFNNGSNANTLTLQTGNTGANLKFVLPTAHGNNGQCLTTDGGVATTTLTFANCLSGSGGGGGITSLNGINATVQTFGVGTSGTDFNIDSTVGTVHTFNLPDASTTARGVVTTSSQTFGGTKTFNDGLTVAASQNFTINGSSFTNLAGNGLQNSSGILTVNAQANHGLEVSGSGVGLISTCGDTQILKWNNGLGQWQCANDAGGSGVGDDVQVNGSAVNTTGNFLNTTANGSAGGTSWTLTPGSPDQITLAIGIADATHAGLVDGNSQSFGGTKTFTSGLTVTSGQTFTFHTDAFTDLTGDGLTITTGALTVNPQSNRGLEVSASGVGLLSSCGDTQILKWNNSLGQWQCANDAGGSGLGDDIQINGSAVNTTGNFIDTTATGSVGGATWTLTPGSPDQISLALGVADSTHAGIVNANAQSFGGAKTIVGNADQTQFIVKANSTQSITSPLVVLQASGGTELARINAVGTTQIAFGYLAGAALQTANSTDNVLIGGQTGSALTTGDYNTAVGSGALQHATGGSDPQASSNTAIGHEALFQNTTGSWNVAIGDQALAGNVVGTNNVAVGTLAGNTVTGSDNTLLGNNAGISLTGASNDILIGSGVQAPTATTSNYLSVGNIYYGDTSAGTGYLRTTSSTAFQVQSAAGADTMLTVDTSARSGSGGNLIKIGNSTGTDTALTILQVDSSAGVPTSNLSALNGGIFYDSSDNHLKVIENNTVNTVCTTVAAAACTTAYGGGGGPTTTLQDAYDNSSSPATITSSSAAKTILFQAGSTFDSATFFQVRDSGSNPVLAVDTSNGRVGIGGAAQTTALKVYGTSSFGFNNNGSNLSVVNGGGSSIFNVITSGTATSNGAYLSNPLNATGGTTLVNSAFLNFQNSYWNGSSAVGNSISLQNIATDTSGNYRLGVLNNGGSELFTFTSTGRLGISNSAPLVDLSFGNGANRTINVATAGASSNGNSLTLQSGAGNGSGTVGGNLILSAAGSTDNYSGGSVIVKPLSDSLQSFQIQNSATLGNNPIFVADTGLFENMITDNGSDFEQSGSVVWTAKTGATLTRATTTAESGRNSLQIATTTSAGSGAKHTIGGLFPFMSSNTYTVSLYAKLSSGSMSTFEIGRSEDGSTDTSCLTAQSLTTSWARFTCTFTVGTISGSPYIYVKQTDAPGVGRTIYVDAIEVITGSTDYTFNPGGALQLLGGLESPLTINTLNGDTPQAFWIQSQAGNNVFDVDTLNSRVGIGTMAPTAALNVVNAATNNQTAVLVNQQNTAQNIMQLQGNGTTVATVSGTGAATFKNSVNSSTAFQIQNASGVAGVNVNNLTTDSNLISNPSFEQNLNGWSAKGSATISLTDAQANFGNNSLKIVDTASGDGAQLAFPLKASTSYSVTFWARTLSGSTTMIIGRQENGSNVETSCSSFSVTTTWTQFNCTNFTTGGTINATSNIYIRQTVAGTPTVYIDGVTVVQAATPLSYSLPGSGLQVSPYYSNVTINALNNGEIQSWQQSTNALPAARDGAAAVAANGFLYVLGGGTASDGASPQNKVYYSRINADGSVGSFTTNANNLNTGVSRAHAVVANGYIYIAGGCTTCSGTQSSVVPTNVVQYARLNQDGSVGSWSTTTALPQARSGAGLVTYNGYIYFVGGTKGASGPSADINRAKVNPDGSISSWTTQSAVIFPDSPYSTQAVVINGYIYVPGGDGAGSALQEVETGKINSDGSVTWVGVAPGEGGNIGAAGLNRTDGGVVGVSNYLYYIGGWDTTSVDSTVLYASTDNAGGIPHWSTSVNPLTFATENAEAVAYNGYIYSIGGDDTGGNVLSSIYYASTARTRINGSLDLLGVQTGNLSEDGSNGMLTAGNTLVAGTLQVQSAASFLRNVNIQGDLAANGYAEFRNSADSTTAFQVQNAAGTDVITTDTTNSKVSLRGINSDAVLGSELVTSQNFTTANWSTCNGGAGGWSGTSSTATHNTGNTTTCSSTGSNFTVSAGATYQITFTVASNNQFAASPAVAVSIGGTAASTTFDQNGTFTTVITTTNTNALVFTPQTNFAGIISAVSVKLVSSTNGAVLAVKNSSNTVTLEVRSSGSTTNSFVGLNTGQNNTSTGVNNTAFGSNSSVLNTAGTDNTAFGYNTLQASTASFNTAFGSQALKVNVTGAQNTAIGSSSLVSNTTGGSNTGVGYHALQANTVGTDNTAIGNNALAAATGQTYYNTAVGSGSLQALGSGGANNDAFGAFALTSLTSGSFNIGIGDSVGSQHTTTSNSVYIGKNAGSLVTSTFKVDADGFGTTDSQNYQTALGADSQVQCANCMVLGSTDNSAPYVGIGTTIPINTLSVSPVEYKSGTISQTASATVVGVNTNFVSSMIGAQLIYADGVSDTVTAVTDATHLTVITPRSHTSSNYRIQFPGLQVANTGRVGIGTTSSTRALTVAVNDSYTSAPQLLVTQAGTGDTTLQFENSSKSFTAGIDSSDSSKFKISSSTASGSYFGNKSTGNQGIANNNTLICSQYTAPTTGTITSLSAYVSTVDAGPNNEFALAIYSNSAGLPNTKLANSTANNLIANSWNRVPINQAVTSGTLYWLCWNSNGSSTNLLRSDTSGGSTAWNFGVSFGTWSAFSSSGTSSANLSIYANYDSYNSSLLSLSDTGQVVFQNSTNSTTGFEIQNAAGTSNLLVADTTNTKIGIGMAPYTGNNNSIALDVNGDGRFAGDLSVMASGSLYFNGYWDNTAFQPRYSAAGYYAEWNGVNGGGIIAGSNGGIGLSVATNGTANNLVTATEVLYIDESGKTLFRNASDSANAFQIQNHANTNTVLIADTTNGRIGIGTTVPNAVLHVAGNTGSSAWGTSGVGLRVSAATYTDSSSSGTVASAVGSSFSTPTFGASSATTYTDASTLYIAGGPVAGSNVTITNSWALNVAGKVLFKNASDSTKAFQIQTSGGASILMADTSNSRVYVGDSSADATGVTLVLDTKNTSGDPTGTDGAMYYNSNYKTFRCYEDGAWVDCRGTGINWTELSDDFVSGQITGGTTGNGTAGGNCTGIGLYNWNTSCQSGYYGVSPGTPAANHPGILSLYTTAANNNVESLRLLAHQSNGDFVRGDVDSMTAIVRPQTTGNYKFFYGLTSDYTSMLTAVSQIGFYYDSSANGNWHIMTRASSTSTTADTGTAFTNGTWYKLQITGISSGTIHFYINDTEVTGSPLSTNVPTSSTALAPGYVEQTLTTATANIDIDYFRMRSAHYGARF